MELVKLELGDSYTIESRFNKGCVLNFPPLTKKCKIEDMFPLVFDGADIVEKEIRKNHIISKIRNEKFEEGYFKDSVLVLYTLHKEDIVSFDVYRIVDRPCSLSAKKIF